MAAQKTTGWEREILALARFLRDAVGPRVLAIRESGELGTEEKRDFTDIKTLGDTTAERLIKDYLHKHFPHHGIRGEEGTNVRGDSEFEWIVDPIDGTTIYASGMSQFGISCGLALRGTSYSGVIHYPAIGVTVSADHMCDALVNGKRIVPRPFSGTQNEKVIAADLAAGTEFLFPALRERFASVLSFGTFVYAALLVAQGQLKAYVSTGATPYDMCAANLLVYKSGGVALGIESDEIDLSKDKSRVILARTRELAEEVRDVISAATPKKGGVS